LTARPAAHSTRDLRLIFLERAAARLALVRGREMKLDEAIDGLVGPFEELVGISYADEIYRRWERDYPPVKRAPRETRGGVAESVVEALVFQLRAGGAALSNQGARQRLAALNEQQMRKVCERVQHFRPHIARPWTGAEIEILVATWKKLK
jgi:hypothetical protein